MKINKSLVIILLLVLVPMFVCESGELISAFDSEGRNRLNDELRKLNDSIRNALNDYAPVGATYIVKTSDGTLSTEFALGSLATGILKVTTSTGALTSTQIDDWLPSQAGNSGKYLTTNGTNSSWGTISTGQLSDVVFQWVGSEGGNVTNSGLCVAANCTTGNDYTGQALYLGDGIAPLTGALPFQFTKLSGQSNLTIQARMKVTGGTGTCQVLVGPTANGTVTTTNTTAFNWVTEGSIDVSGLTTGQDYSGNISITNSDASPHQTTYLSNLILRAN